MLSAQQHSLRSWSTLLAGTYTGESGKTNSQFITSAECVKKARNCHYLTYDESHPPPLEFRQVDRNITKKNPAGAPCPPCSLLPYPILSIPRKLVAALTGTMEHPKAGKYKNGDKLSGRDENDFHRRGEQKKMSTHQGGVSNNRSQLPDGGVGLARSSHPKGDTEGSGSTGWAVASWRCLNFNGRQRQRRTGDVCRCGSGDLNGGGTGRGWERGARRSWPGTDTRTD